MPDTTDARLDPLPGDYWEDHMVPVAVVLAVTPHMVTLCTERRDVPPNHWTWDLNKTMNVTRERFETWFAYDTIPGTWASVHREAHKSFAREYAAMQPNTGGKP